MEELLKYVIDVGLGEGAEYVEARYHKLTESYVAMRFDKVISIGKSVSEGVGIRVLVNGSLGFASTNILTKDVLEETVRKAIAKAKALAKQHREPIEFADIKAEEAKYDVKPKIAFENVSVEEKIKLYKQLLSNLRSSLQKTKLQTFFIEHMESTEEKYLVTSEEARIRSVIPRVMVYGGYTIYSPEKGTMQRTFEKGGSGGLELLEKWDLIRNVPEEAKMLEEVLLKGVSPPKGKVDVIVGSEVVGLIVHESCGHPSEADRILGREAAQAGESFIKENMIGRRIGTEKATVIDDPTIPGSYGYYLYDDEGVRARPKYLYKNGVINELLHNRWTAKVFRVESNGSARAADYTSEPIIRMSNTYLEPGKLSFEELLEGVKLGVYIKTYMEWNIDDLRWSQRYVGLEAYLIDHGEIRGYVRYPVLEITTESFYSSIEAVDKNLEFHAGTCGKGEPAQGVPVWFGGPNVKLKNIVLGVAPY